MNKLSERLLWTLVLIFIWWITAFAGGFSPLILPAPTEVASALYSGFIEGSLGIQILISIFLVSSGMFVGTLVAFMLLFLSVSSKAGKGLVETLNAVFHPLAGIALLPVVILWFGTGAVSVIFIIIHSAVWPMVTNMRAGYESLPESYLMVGRNYELGKWQMLLRIAIPGSFPYILAGLKISWARAWRALISAEMIFGAVLGRGGIGWFIFSKRVFMDTSGMFAGIIVVVIIGILVEDLVFGFAENRTLQRWGMKV